MECIIAGSLHLWHLSFLKNGKPRYASLQPPHPADKDALHSAVVLMDLEPV
jgi:hypothetical protein